MPLERNWWAVDKVILAYLAATGLLVAAYFPVVPFAAELLAAKALGALLIVLAVKYPSRIVAVFRHWYPLPYVGLCYKEMAILIPAIRRSDADQWLADLDYRLWGAHPTVWLERVQSPLLTEVLQILYSLFVPAVLVIAVVLWRRRRYAEFRYYAFLIALGFLASYVGYFVVPARGPRFLLTHLQHTRLEGLWLFHALQAGLDRLESAHYDCFPSGHTELTMLAWWSSQAFGNRIFAAYFVYTLGIIFATVYLRYHYTIDVLAGMALATLLIVAAPVLFRRLQKGN